VAALQRCPLFAWIWNQVTRAQTPPEQLLKTHIQFEFETRGTVGHLITENSYAATLLVSTELYSWPVARFDVASHFGELCRFLFVPDID